LLGTSSLIPPLAERYWHGKGFVYILDANGRRIAVLWGKIVEKIAMAELICDAVSGHTDGAKTANRCPIQ
jgi:hypothetical protein